LVFGLSVECERKGLVEIGGNKTKVYWAEELWWWWLFKFLSS
jgi:hypothetical protein